MRRFAIIIFTIILYILTCSNTVLGQDVTLITMGEGETRETAIKNALVSAIEQAYGVYVSGDTRILNDELIRDEVVQLKRGNIQKYNILTESRQGNEYSVVLESTVSNEKLLKFAQSKGAACELAGDKFSINLNLFRLHAGNGARAMKQLYHMLGLLSQKMFDYNINLGEPIVYKSDVYIPVAIECVLNDNYTTFIDLYNSCNKSVTHSITSISIKGSADDGNIKLIGKYREYIKRLPWMWAMGFCIWDNWGNCIGPYIDKKCFDQKYIEMPDFGYWPSEGVKDFCIAEPPGGDEPYIYGWKGNRYEYIIDKPFVFITNKRKDSQDMAFLRIQRLSDTPLCSLAKGEKSNEEFRRDAKSVLRDFAASSRIQGMTVSDTFISMCVWNNGEHKVRNYEWIGDASKIVGKPLCTVNFFLCYTEEEISKTAGLKVQSISD